MATDYEEDMIVDWGNQGLCSLNLLPCHLHLTTLLADHNCLTKLDSLTECPFLQHLSLAHNRLVHLSGLSHLRHLTVLNLPSNSICSLKGLENLAQLLWLDLSGNNIQDMECLAQLVRLQHMDLSDNSISAFADLRALTDLKSLLLHGNILTNLSAVPECLPVSLATLSLEANLIEDLTQVSYLFYLPKLTQLSVARNPCLHMTPNQEGFDHRLYVLCCCPSLQILDGFIVSDGERLQAQWLYRQGYVLQVCPGQHTLLIHYLATVCPLTSADQRHSTEDGQVSCILSKQLAHYNSSESHSKWPQNLLQDQTPGDHGHSNNKLLDSESTYVPLSTASPEKICPTPDSFQPASPNTTASWRSHQLTSLAESSLKVQSGNKYQKQEQCQKCSLNQEVGEGKIRSAFAASLPLCSSAEPHPHIARHTPPTACSEDYDMSLTSFSGVVADPDSETAACLSLIREVADHKRLSKEHKMRENSSPVPVSHPGQSLNKQSKVRVKGLDSNRQAELSKLVKCQQNADRLVQHRDRHRANVSNPTGVTPDFALGQHSVCDASLTTWGQEGHRAATAIQAVWRGYRAREYNIHVLSVRKEIRARRAEDHIVLLRAELDRHKKLYHEEKRLRTLQMEAIRCLYHEVQQLKEHMESSQSGHMHSKLHSPAASDGCADSGPLRSEMASVGPGCGTGLCFADLQRTAELERKCAFLQSQISQLQEALQSISIVSQGSLEFSSFSTADKESHNMVDPELVKSVHVSEYRQREQHEPGFANTDGAPCHWTSVPHSLSPYPSEEEELYFRQIPHDGGPTPPRSLSLHHQGDHSVLLRWLPSQVEQHLSPHRKSHVTGYKIYINDHLKGDISGKKTSAVVSGLNTSETYKFYVKGVSNQGESFASNIVMARLAHGTERQLIAVSSDSDMPADSDKDHDSVEGQDKRRLRKRDSRKHRKVRSPRSEKKLVRTTSDKTGEEGQKDECREDRNNPCDILTQAKLHKPKHTQGTEQREPSGLAHVPDNQPTVLVSSQPVVGTPSPAREAVRTGSPASQSSSPHRHPSSPIADEGQARTSTSHGNQRSGERDNVGSDHKRDLPMPPAASGPHGSLSETFTVDKMKSFLFRLGSPATDSTAEGKASSEGGTGRLHQLKGSREPSPALDITGVHPELPKDKMSSDRIPSSGQIDLKSNEEGSKIHLGHHAASRDCSSFHLTEEVQKQEANLNSLGRAEGVLSVSNKDKERCSTPVLDGRRRSRPNSPIVSEGAGSDQRDQETSVADRRRTSTAEILEQRLCPVKKSWSLNNMPEQEQEIDSKAVLQNSSKCSPSSDSLHDNSQGDKPHRSSLHQRTHSVGSEGDCTAAKSGRKEAVATSLVAKLQALTHSQEASLRETGTRLRRRSNEEDEKRKSSGRTRHISESDADMLSDAGCSLPPHAPISDSSSGSHSDDGRIVHSYRRTHRRSPSDHQRQVSGSDSVSSLPVHSPIIMEGRKGSTSVRRHASFHALPSRPSDTSLPGQCAEEAAVSVPIGQTDDGMSTGRVPSPQESLGNPRCSIRSRSPSPNRNRQPVLSAAPWKRQGEANGKSPS